MVSLIVTACLLATPAKCEEFYLPGEVSPMQCALFGQQQLAEWSKYHPKWKISGWECRPVGQVGA